MDQKSVAAAVKQICDEKGIPLASVIETIEAALAAAYRKDFGSKNQNIKVEFDLETGKIRVFDVKTVVEDLPEQELLVEPEKEGVIKKSEEEIKPKVEIKEESEPTGEEVKRFNPKTEIQLAEALNIKNDAKIDDVIKTELEVPGDFGRMAAQTAKQVIIQKLREIEREVVYEEFKNKEREIMVGVVQRQEGRIVLVDLGKTTAILPQEEQIESENYVPGARLKIYILSVNATPKGPEIIVSRSHPEILKKLFILEIPEIANGVVEIKAIAREAGARSKIAVWTSQENIDPIGSCIGQRGARIQTIISELKGEKVDIIKYSEEPAEFIANALSPAKILDIKIDEKGKTATAEVAEEQLSLAIGKAGQNVRLAAKLTGWRIDIVASGSKKSEAKEEKENLEEDSKEIAGVVVEEKKEEKTAEPEKIETESEKKDKEPEGKSTEEKSAAGLEVAAPLVEAKGELEVKADEKEKKIKKKTTKKEKTKKAKVND